MASLLQFCRYQLKTQEVFEMKNVARLVFSPLASLIVASAVCALPTTHRLPLQSSSAEQTAPQTQSVSGKIASVDKTSFTLTVATGTSNSAQQLQPTATPKTMNFTVDQNTTIDGKLQVGASADVTYREDSGKNVAISVRVQP
jgi:hypothetical protein